jgi:predicted PolB exonuclease-like 3'-5' exonuclease
MSGGYLVLDIETVPDPALYERPEIQNGIALPFPPLYVHRTIVIGAVWLDPEYRLRRIGVIGDGKDEKEMLQDFSSFVGRYHPELVT